MTIMDDVAMLVHVGNPHDIASAINGAPKVEEAAAPHAVASTWLLPTLGTVNAQQNNPVEILPLDILRKRAVITFNGSGQVIICHSQAQAQSLQQNVQQAADEGCLLTVPGTIVHESTAALWAVGVPASTSANTIGVAGKVTAPTALQQITGSLLSTPGTYSVQATAYLDGTIVLATDGDNMEITFTGGNPIPLLVPGVADVPMTTGPYLFTSTGTQTVAVKAIGAGSVAATYHAALDITPYPFAVTSGVVTVGSLTERRDS
jgi:hypothetical protein